MQGPNVVIKVNNKTELNFTIKITKSGGKAFAVPVEEFTKFKDSQIYRSEGAFRSGSQDYSTDDLTKDELVAYIIERYKDRAETILAYDLKIRNE